MTTFTNGQTATLTLDVQDTLTISGSARLEITEAFTPKFETTVSGGTQTMGPFGAVTQVIIHGTGNGSFTQQPSNNPVPVTIVDISASQVSSPTAKQLAATNTLYQLNSAPYSVYQSNGTSLTPFGGGGVSAFTSLLDATTAPIPTTNVPLSTALAAKADATATTTALAAKADATATTNAIALKADAAATATALAAKQAALVSGTTLKTINGIALLGAGDLTVAGTSLANNLTTTTTGASALDAAQGSVIAASLAAKQVALAAATFSTAIDLTGNKTFGLYTMAGNVTLSLAASPVDGGQLKVTFKPDGFSTVTIPSAWVQFGGSQTYSQSNYNVLYVQYEAATSTVFYGWITGAAYSPTVVIPGAPTLSASTTTDTTQILTWTAPTTGSAPTDYTVQYSLSGAGSWTTFSHSVSTALGNTVSGLTQNTNYDFRVAGVNSAGTGTYSNIITRMTAVTPVAVPGQVTGLTSTAQDSGSVTLLWTAPTTGGTPSNYVVQYALASSGSWFTFAHATSTANNLQVIGLTAATSYDFRVAASNSAGAGTYSTTYTHSTSASGISASFTGTNGTVITGTATDTGGQTWTQFGVYGTNDAVIQSNAASVSGTYTFCAEYVTTPNSDGTVSGTCVSGDAFLLGQVNNTQDSCVRAGLRGGYAVVDVVSRGGVNSMFTATSLQSSGAHALVLILAGTNATFKVDGTIVYTTTNIYSALPGAHIADPVVAAYGFGLETSGVLDSFLWTP